MAEAKYIQKVIKLPAYLTPEQREAIAVEIVDYIRKRSEDGRDVDEKPFPKYSKDYKGSFNFKVAHKDSDVNLSLTGDMLATLRLLKHTDGKILIGYDPSDSEAGRAEGNQRGTYGQKTPTAPPRKFIGIASDKLKEILKKYPKSSEEKRDKRAEQVLELKRASSILEDADAVEEDDF